MTTAIILLIIVLTVIHFYLKCSLMTSFSTLVAAIFATVIAFSYHEAMADLFISRGYGADWALSGCYVLAFILGSALFRALADLLVGSSIDLGKHARVAASLICGLITGVIIAGNLLVSMGLMPVQHKVIYSRFPADRQIILTNPQLPVVNADGFVTGLFSWLSRGALASDTSFAVVQTDFLNKIHLNRYYIQKDVQSIASRKCLSLPPRDKKPIRLWSVPEKGNYTVVRIGIVSKSIPDGGANNAAGQIKFGMAQLRLICKPTGEADHLRGVGEAILPAGLLQYRNPNRPTEGKQFVAKGLDDVIEPDDTLGMRERMLWVDVAFKVPDGMRPVMFQFKQNAMVSLLGLEPVQSTPEIEQELDAPEEKEPQAQPAEGAGF